MKVTRPVPTTRDTMASVLNKFLGLRVVKKGQHFGLKNSPGWKHDHFKHQREALRQRHSPIGSALPVPLGIEPPLGISALDRVENTMSSFLGYTKHVVGSGLVGLPLQPSMEMFMDGEMLVCWMMAMVNMDHTKDTMSRHFLCLTSILSFMREVVVKQQGNLHKVKVMEAFDTTTQALKYWQQCSLSRKGTGAFTKFDKAYLDSLRCVDFADETLEEVEGPCEEEVHARYGAWRKTMVSYLSDSNWTWTDFLDCSCSPSYVLSDKPGIPIFPAQPRGCVDTLAKAGYAINAMLCYVLDEYSMYALDCLVRDGLTPKVLEQLRCASVCVLHWGYLAPIRAFALTAALKWTPPPSRQNNIWVKDGNVWLRTPNTKRKNLHVEEGTASPMEQVLLGSSIGGQVLKVYGEMARPLLTTPTNKSFLLHNDGTPLPYQKYSNVYQRVMKKVVAEVELGWSPEELDFFNVACPKNSVQLRHLYGFMACLQEQSLHKTYSTAMDTSLEMLKKKYRKWPSPKQHGTSVEEVLAAYILAFPSSNVKDE